MNTCRLCNKIGHDILCHPCCLNVKKYVNTKKMFDKIQQQMLEIEFTIFRSSLEN
jgi:hypothetical protein